MILNSSHDNSVAAKQFGLQANHLLSSGTELHKLQLTLLRERLDLPATTGREEPRKYSKNFVARKGK